MKDCDILKSIIEEIDILISKGVDSGSPDFQAWKNKTIRFLIRYFGEDSFEYRDFEKRRFSLAVFTTRTPDSAFVNACASELRVVKAILSNYLGEMSSSQTKNDRTSTSSCPDFSSIFIVHGHDGELREAVARLVEKQGIRPIILMDQANKGATIIEKFEAYSNTGAAICLFTADDIGCAKGESDSDLRKRARQNVVFETGFFIGKLGRKGVIIVADHSIEIPSDLQGVVYTNVDNWKLDVLRELKAMGYSIDYNKIDG